MIFTHEVSVAERPPLPTWSRWIYCQLLPSSSSILVTSSQIGGCREEIEARKTTPRSTSHWIARVAVRIFLRRLVWLSRRRRRTHTPWSWWWSALEVAMIVTTAEDSSLPVRGVDKEELVRSVFYWRRQSFVWLKLANNFNAQHENRRSWRIRSTITSANFLLRLSLSTRP